jgi:ribulose 1,5-bisphosphate synthetase/thiazole synthase
MGERSLSVDEAERTTVENTKKFSPTICFGYGVEWG